MTIMLFSIGVISRELFPQRANFLIQYSYYLVSLTTNEIEQQLFRSMTELVFFLLPELPETFNVTNRIRVKAPSLMGGMSYSF